MNSLFNTLVEFGSSHLLKDNEMAYFKKKSFITGLSRTIKIPEYEQDDFDNRFNAFKSGKATVEEAFPNLSANVVLFLTMGVTPEEYSDYFKTQELP